jgi:hypothetical protein
MPQASRQVNRPRVQADITPDLKSIRAQHQRKHRLDRRQCLLRSLRWRRAESACLGPASPVANKSRTPISTQGRTRKRKKHTLRGMTWFGVGRAPVVRSAWVGRWPTTRQGHSLRAPNSPPEPTPFHFLVDGKQLAQSIRLLYESRRRSCNWYILKDGSHPTFGGITRQNSLTDIAPIENQSTKATQRMAREQERRLLVRNVQTAGKRGRGMAQELSQT